MMGITFNVHALCFFAAHGLSGAASARVGNDLGAARPRRAWLTVQAAVLMGTVAMAGAALLLMLGRSRLGALFSSDAAVVALTATAVPPLAASLVGEGANTVLSGVMRGCGRQRIGAAVNLVTYWAVGLPLSCALAFKGGAGGLGPVDGAGLHGLSPGPPDDPDRLHVRLAGRVGARAGARGERGPRARGLG